MKIAQGNENIERFLEGYYQLHYEKLANDAADICKKMLADADIKAIVSWRKKEKISTQNKLMSINRTKIRKHLPCFQSVQEVRSSISDLAGVRIAVYVPSQKERVIELIKTWFKEVEVIKKRQTGTSICAQCEEKIEERHCIKCRQSSSHMTTVDEAGNESSILNDLYSPVFAGYSADHARVKLFPDQAKGLPDWKEDQVVEIQVVSVLLHAWAEVEHDITYKSIKADAGMEERQILDCLNGQILSAEMLLNQLHSVHTSRVKSLDRPLANKYELAVFLGPYIDRFLSPADRSNLDLKMLFGLLRAVHLHTPGKLRPLLEDIGFKPQNKLEALVNPTDASHHPITTRLPFQLATHMRIPFYAMERIVSKITKEQETTVRQKAQSDMDKNTYTSLVIFSSFVWLGELAWEGSIEKVVREYVEPNASKHEKEHLNWIFDGPARVDILLKRGDFGAMEEKTLEVIWNWFLEQDEDSLFHFIFRVSRMGVFGSFPQDLRLFRKAGKSK